MRTDQVFFHFDIFCVHFKIESRFPRTGNLLTGKFQKKGSNFIFVSFCSQVRPWPAAVTCTRSINNSETLSPEPKRFSWRGRPATAPASVSFFAAATRPAATPPNCGRSSSRTSDPTVPPKGARHLFFRLRYHICFSSLLVGISATWTPQKLSQDCHWPTSRQPVSFCLDIRQVALETFRKHGFDHLSHSCRSPVIPCFLMSIF